MSDSLSTVDISDALDPLTVEETRSLFFKLRVPLKCLDDIADQYVGENRKQHYIQKWLDMYLDASWDKLVAGLRKIKKNSLAAKIESKHILGAMVPRSSSLLSTSSVSASREINNTHGHLVTLTPAPVQKQAIGTE